MKTIVSLFFFILLFSIPPAHAAAGKYFDFSYAVKEAYQKTLQLRFKEARSAIDALKSSEPDNLAPVFIENYLEFLTVYIDDDKQEFKRLVKNMDSRLAKMARGDHNSPYFLYTQAEIRLQWALLHLRYNEYLSGMSDVKQAYALLEENQRKFPDFIANKKSLGIIHAIVGNVPEEYKWAVKALSGITGTTTQGLQELETVLAYAKQHAFLFEDEATVAYAFLQLYLNNSSELSWKTLKNSKLDPKSNPMALYAMAMVAMRTSHNDEAITLLQATPKSDAFHPFPQLDYLLGLAKLRRLDADANKPLEAFVHNFNGQNGVKDAYQKIAWHQLVHNNEAGYNAYIKLLQLKGAEDSEPDKAAARESKSAELPDPRLLRARLLFDGGYYQRAYDLLKNAAGDYTGSLKKNLEFNYRMGRINHKMGKTMEAQQYYYQAIESGASYPWYFACNAALQLGILQEEKRDYKNARDAFNRCLGFKPEEYAGSLHAQAKAGLGRIKEK